jgi:hypothetical protein
MSHKTSLLMSTVAMPLLAGCLANATVPININDTSAPFYSVRAEWHPRENVNDALGKGSDGVEFQYTKTAGLSDQSLATGEVMSVGGNSIVGPQQISHRVDISYAHLAYSGTAHMEKYPAEMDAFMGLGRVNYSLRSDVTTAPLALQSSQTDYALTMGMGLRWRFLDNTSAEGRVVLLTQNPFSYFIGTYGKGKQTDMIQGELALVYKPVKSVALRGGYAWMALVPEKTADSPLDLRLRGPLVGLEVFF